jgi:hypothetical protein
MPPCLPSSLDSHCSDLAREKRHGEYRDEGGQTGCGRECSEGTPTKSNAEAWGGQRFLFCTSCFLLIESRGSQYWGSAGEGEHGKIIGRRSRERM